SAVRATPAADRPLPSTVRAALAALRSKKRQPPSDSVASPSADAGADPFATPARVSASAGREDGARIDCRDSVREETSGTPGEGEEGDEPVLLEWDVKGEDKLVEAARKTGRLNLASRSLSSVPASVYSALLPRSSLYHPSNRNPSHYRRAPQPDLSMAAAEGDEDRSAAWYEQQDLRTLNLANNEIEQVGDELGGFEELEVLDLHNNLLSTLPASVGYLVNITSLNLAHNRLASFPLQVLNLKHLRDLSLAHNQITHLWAADWRAQLDDVLKPPEASPSATPESANGRDAAPSFWDSFPSSPAKRAAQDVPSSTAPFPFLATLSLAGNPLTDEALTQEGFELPPRLTSLDLSACGLTDRALPPNVLGSLTKLKELDLSANELSDDLFSSSLSPLPSTHPARLFPSLETLNLSLNSLDTLESFEALLQRDIRRPTSYTGLPHVIDNLVRNEERRTGRRLGVPPNASDEDALTTKELSVLVRECPLRVEQARRRARFPVTATSAAREVAAAKTAARETPAAPLADDKSEPRAAQKVPSPRARSPSPPPSPSPAPAPAFAAPPSTPSRRRPVVLEDWEETPPATPREASDPGSPPPYSPREMAVVPPVEPAAASPQSASLSPDEADHEADPSDPAVELVAAAFSRASSRSTVALAGRSLSALPSPTTGAPPAALSSPSHADLARNTLPSFPLNALATWGWCASLRVLNLSNNRLAAIEVLGAAPTHGAPLFPSLETLDLSNNFLPSHVASPFPLASRLPPSLGTDDSGAVPLLAALAFLCPSLSTLSLRGNRLTTLSGISALLLPNEDAGVKGVRRLDLGENRVRAVDELCAVAERYDADAEGARTSWRCEELDLSMNDIASLPPKLGLLPPALVLHLVGNTFRLPRRDVYENAGERLVIPWLRDRL
ncbi:leucine-rich repeat-containing protein 40, partial [Rhodotorula diobovata]